jgi:exodeoxyribonuclease VII small subunit
MADESYSFSTARTRLDAIVTQVRKKDTSLEKSLDLLEEGVRLANACTELIDHADWVAAEATPPEAVETAEAEADAVTDASGPNGDAQSEVAEDSGDPADEAWADEVPSDGPMPDNDTAPDER